MDKDKLVKLVELTEELNKVTNDNSDTYKHKKEYHDLLMSMGSVISKTCGNLNKIYEKTVELDLLLNDTQAKHINDSYGSDLIITGKNKEKIDVEVKTSTVVKSKSFRSNWNFVVKLKSFDIGDDDEDGQIFENRLFHHISKQYSGIIKIAAVNEGKLFYSCTLSGLFLSLLLTKMITKSGTFNDKKSINLGSSYCEYHKTYHRLERLLKMDLVISERLIKMKVEPSTSILNANEWKDLLKSTSACINKK